MGASRTVATAMPSECTAVCACSIIYVGVEFNNITMAVLPTLTAKMTVWKLE